MPESHDYNYIEFDFIELEKRNENNNTLLEECILKN